MFPRKLAAFFISSAIVFASGAQALEFKLGDIEIEHPYARATMPQQASGAAFMVLENKGKFNDKLVKAESTVSKSVQLHVMEMTANHVMKMREVDAIELPATSEIKMHPGGGYHLMLIDLKKPLTAGEKFTLTLYFEKAGKIDVTVEVQAMAASKHAHH